MEWFAGETGGVHPRRPSATAWRSLELSAAAALAVTQPLFSVIAENPTFLVAHQLQGVRLVLFAVVVALAPALVAVAVGWSASALGQRLGDWVHLVLIGLFLGLTIGPPVNRWMGWEGFMSIITVVVVGVGVALLYMRWSPLTTVLRVTAVVPLVFLGYFVFTQPVAALVSPVEVESIEAEAGDLSSPVVWLIFDQFPLALLMDGEGRIVEDRYPNFARLSRISTWYPNAATVAPNTHLAVPAMLTGRHPNLATAPITPSYPVNLFTILGQSRRVVAREAVTRMCPSGYCPPDAEDRADAASLWKDTGVVVGRLLMGDAVADSFLPEINDRWAGFGPEAGAGGLRPGDERGFFNDFLATIGANQPPTLHYFHMEKPHEPLVMLPDGRMYDYCSCFRTLPDESWPDSPEMMGQRLQQYVMQAMYTDHELGRLLDKLEAEEILDRTMLIVTSDHGASMLPGHVNRSVSSATADEVFPVPMFVKLPDQDTGAVDGRMATVLDLLPTVVDVLDISTPTSFDGLSLLDPPVDRPLRVTSPEGLVTITADARNSPLIDMVAELLPRPEDPFAFGLHADLVGRPVLDLIAGQSDLGAEIANIRRFGGVDLGADYVPALVVGELRGADGPVDLAVAFNGTVAGVGSTYEIDLWRIAVMGDPGYLVEGPNEVALYEVTEEGLLIVAIGSFE